MNKTRISWFVCVLVTVLFLAGCASSGPSATVKAFYQDVEAGHIDQAVDLLDLSGASADEKAMAQAKMKAMLTAMQSQIKSKGGIKSIDVKKVDKTDAEHAEVSVVVHFGNGDEAQDRQAVVKRKGKWLIRVN